MRNGGRDTGKIFWGVILIAGAVLLLANKMGFLGGIGFGTIAFNVLLAAIFLNGLIKGSFGQILFSLAFVAIFNDEFLGLEAITPMPVLIAALLGTIGLNMVFPGFARHGFLKKKGDWGNQTFSESRDGDRVFYENAFGESVKYIVGEISAVKVENAFGGMQVFFSDAVLKENKACARVQNSFGRISLFVPAGWRVVLNVNTSFGTVSEKGAGNPLGDNILYVEGEVSFGELRIVYI